MPPKKRIDPKEVTRPITSFNFNPLTQLEVEALRTQDKLDCLQRQIVRQEEEEKRKEIANMTELLVNATNRLDIVNTFEAAIQTLADRVETNTYKVSKVKKCYKKRPPEWKEIAVHYQNFKSVDKTVAAYNLLEINQNISTWAVNLGRWSKDVINKKENSSVKSPVIGGFLDQALADVVTKYFAHGVPMSNLILQSTLLQLMETHNRHDLLERCNFHDPRNVPGTQWFIRLGSSWCSRFYKRHNFSSRVPTTKMRNDLPADYETKKKKFIYILSKAVGDNNIPDDLIVNIDETNTQFVPSVTRTRCPKGIRKVRIIGIGMEKPQITTTFGASATAVILEPAQLIFGGTTARCHPNGGKTAPPANQYYDHTDSHWQTPETFITYITKTILPYKAATIARMELPVDQKMILLLDLHYSHKSPAVLALLRANNIIVVFIPAGCTDLHQLCDVILNKSYKSGTKEAFVDYLSEQFIAWAQTPNRDMSNDVFTISLAISVMKPLLPTFVNRGLAAINAEHMKEPIREAFQNQCLLRIARLPETYALACAELPEDVGSVEVSEEVEEEEDLGPVTTENQLEEEPIHSFDVEVVRADSLDKEDSLSESSDSEDSEPLVTKRTRLPNAMVGSVKKGKYSH